jgi:hypothetical protein
VRRARLAMMVKATNDCAAASSGTETIEEKITSMRFGCREHSNGNRCQR